jgi:hypothetical protein
VEYSAVVVFLVQPGEKNSIDQRQLGYKLQEKYVRHVFAYFGI